MRGVIRFVLFLIVFVGVSVALVQVELGKPGFYIDGDDGVVALAQAAQPAVTDEAPGREDSELGRLQVVSRVIGFVRGRYVDPKRVDPVAMFMGSLRRLERSVTELMVRPVGDDEEHPEAVRVIAGTAEHRFDLSGLTDLYRLSWTMVDLFRFLRESLSEDALDEHAEFTAASGLVKVLDPHSTVMNPDQYKEMRIGTYGKFGGLGIVISIRKAKLTIISVIDDTPAYRAGLKKGDHIVQIGDESTINMGLDEAVRLMRGDPGTRVTVWILREGFEQPKAYPITRAIIRVKSVSHKRLERAIGYIKIKNFNSNTTSGVRDAIRQMSSDRPLQGLIIDLRNDPGGLLSQAVRVSDVFIEEGTIVTTVGQAGKVREEKKASKGDTEKDLPLVVLVDSASASASEIVAGALKYNGRALIVGERTFGKATVQELYDIAEGALKLTVAQYLTPGDVLIQNVGITPDIALYPVALEEGDNQIYANEIEQFGEKDLENTLENERAEAPLPLTTIKFALPKEPDDDTPRDYDAIEVDFPVTFARDLLLAAGEPKGGRFFERARTFLEVTRRKQEEVIVAGLFRQDIRWNAGPDATAPDLSVTLDVAPAGREIKAGEELTIRMRVTNRGDQDVYRVHALLDASWGVLDEREIIVGAVRAGDTRGGAVTFTIPKTAHTRHERVTARLFQDYTPLEDLDPQLDLVFEAIAQPDFAVLVVPRGKADPNLYADQDLVLQVRVKNTGSAPAEELTVALKSLNGDRVLLKKGRVKHEDFKVGDVAKAEFEVHLNRPGYDEPLEFTVSAYDSTSRQHVSVPVIIAAPEGPAVEEAPGVVRLTRDALLGILPRDDAASAGLLKAGSVVPRVARHGERVQILLDADGLAGWVAQADVEPFSKGGAADYRFEPHFAFSPPDISLTQPLPLVVRERELVVEGEIVFHSAFAAPRGDVMAYRNKDKVYFERVDLEGSGPRTARFRFTVELEPGRNRIRVKGRTGTKLRRSEDFYVFFDDPSATTQGGKP